MFDLKRLRETAMREGMKLMGNPRVMKLMSNPRVMQVMMQAFELRGSVQAAVDARMKRLARTLRLATRDDVSSLAASVRSLEQAVQAVRVKVDGNGAQPRA